MQVSLDPEGTLDFQVFQDRVLTEAEGRMVFQGFLELRASPERSWEPHLEPRDRTVYVESLETRASQEHQEHLDCPVGQRFKLSDISVIFSTQFISKRVYAKTIVEEVVEEV